LTEVLAGSKLGSITFLGLTTISFWEAIRSSIEICSTPGYSSTKSVSSPIVLVVRPLDPSEDTILFPIFLNDLVFP
jgi:hypothetical protein